MAPPSPFGDEVGKRLHHLGEAREAVISHVEAAAVTRALTDSRQSREASFVSLGGLPCGSEQIDQLTIDLGFAWERLFAGG